MKKNLPKEKPVTTGTEGQALPESYLHTEDKRNSPDGKDHLSGGMGFKAGKPPGGNR